MSGWTVSWGRSPRQRVAFREWADALEACSISVRAPQARADILSLVAMRNRVETTATPATGDFRGTVLQGASYKVIHGRKGKTVPRGARELEARAETVGDQHARETLLETA